MRISILALIVLLGGCAQVNSVLSSAIPYWERPMMRWER